MKRWRLAGALLTLLLPLIAATAVSAQDEGWVVPDDYVPPDTIPTAPPPPFVPVGPVLFDEPEFPFGSNADGFVTNTLNAVPLDGPLLFEAPAGASFGNGPGPITLFTPPGIIGQTAGALRIDFGVDVSEVSFNFALQCGIASNGAIDVTALDSGMAVVGMTTVAGQDFGDFFIQNSVVFSPGSFRSIEITLSSGPGCRAYAIDFLAWDTLAPAPAMGPLWLAALAAALLGIGTWVLRRRSA